MYSLIVSVEPNLPAFMEYMRKRGIVLNEENGLDYKADYKGIGLTMKVAYCVPRRTSVHYQDGEIQFRVGALLIIGGLEEGLVYHETGEILKSVKEVEDPESVRFIASRMMQA